MCFMFYPGWTSARVTAVALTSSPQNSGQSVPCLAIKPPHNHLPSFSPMVWYTHLHWLQAFQRLSTITSINHNKIKRMNKNIL